jgi:hypothetical protein
MGECRLVRVAPRPHHHPRARAGFQSNGEARSIHCDLPVTNSYARTLVFSVSPRLNDNRARLGLAYVDQLVGCVKRSDDAPSRPLPASS